MIILNEKRISKTVDESFIQSQEIFNLSIDLVKAIGKLVERMRSLDELMSTLEGSNTLKGGDTDD